MTLHPDTPPLDTSHHDGIASSALMAFSCKAFLVNASKLKNRLHVLVEELELEEEHREHHSVFTQKLGQLANDIDVFNGLFNSNHLASSDSECKVRALLTVLGNTDTELRSALKDFKVPRRARKSDYSAVHRRLVGRLRKQNSSVQAAYTELLSKLVPQRDQHG